METRFARVIRVDVHLVTREYPVAFKLLRQSGWVATLELRDNPVLLYFGANKDRIERDVRSREAKE